MAGPIARSSFADLCGKALGASDYLALTKRFSILALDGVPILTNDLRNEASRFEVLIDTLYEAGTLLILRSQVAIDQLNQGLTSVEFPRTLSRLQEMRGSAYVERALANLAKTKASQT